MYMALLSALFTEERSHKKNKLQKLKGPDFSELDIKLVPDPPSDVAK